MASPARWRTTSTFAVGYAEAIDAFSSVPANFGSVDSTAVLVRYTYYGDANSDGKVNLLDFNKIAANFNGSGKVWSDGDFTYDGNVNLNDFNKLAANFNNDLEDDGGGEGRGGRSGAAIRITRTKSCWRCSGTTPAVGEPGPPAERVEQVTTERPPPMRGGRCLIWQD